MRVLGTLGLAFAAGLLAVGLASGQRPGGFGGGRGGANADPTSLVHNPKVKEELKLTEEQVKKLDEAFAKAIGSVLDPDQAKRLNQIHLQMKGSKAFTDAKIQSELKFTAEQKDSIKTILDDTEKEVKELSKEFNKETRTKIFTLRKDETEKVRNVLTDTQKKAWQEIIGTEFKMDGGGGFKGKGKNKEA